MKDEVFCSNCYYSKEWIVENQDMCIYPDNLKWKQNHNDRWATEKKSQRRLNKDNHCSWYKGK